MLALISSATTLALLSGAAPLDTPKFKASTSRRAALLGGAAAAVMVPSAPAWAKDKNTPKGPFDGSWAVHEGAFDDGFFRDFTVSKASPDFVYKFVEKPDAGEKPVPGQKVWVNYCGYLLDGKKFDSSYSKDEPFSFRVGKGKVISGWEAVVQGMVPGQKVIVRIPPQYAYGDKGIGPIPGGASLVFYMELVALGNIKTYGMSQDAAAEN